MPINENRIGNRVRDHRKLLSVTQTYFVSLIISSMWSATPFDWHWSCSVSNHYHIMFWFCCHYTQSIHQRIALHFAHFADAMAESNHQECDAKKAEEKNQSAHNQNQTSFVSFSDDSIIVYIATRLQHAYSLKIHHLSHSEFLRSHYLMRMILIS